MSEVTDLSAAVAGITTAVNAAVTDIQALTAALAANPDPAAIETAVGELNTLAQNLNNAVNPTPAPVA